jgi:hypothetical protein
MEVTTVFSRSFPETTALQLNSWHLDDTATHRGSYAFGNGALDSTVKNGRPEGVGFPHTCTPAICHNQTEPLFCLIYGDLKNTQTENTTRVR